MALTQITWTNKETLNDQPSIPEKNKVTANNMNEIKSVVNGACTQVDTNTSDITNINNELYDSGWVDLVYNNQDVSQRAGDLYKAQIRRWGRLVQIKGQITSNVGDLSDNTSLSIPSNRLSDFYTGNMEIQMITNACFYWIDSNGTLHITSNPGMFYINIGGVYMYA